MILYVIWMGLQTTVIYASSKSLLYRSENPQSIYMILEDNPNFFEYFWYTQIDHPI